MPSPNTADKPEVSVVVPTYREAENLPALIDGVFDAFAAAGISAEMIVVDDDSRDGTDRVVAERAARWPVRLITRTAERGLSSAVLRGFADARGDILVVMDADLSHPPQRVPDVVAPVRGGQADFCIGSRYVAGGATTEDWGLLRRINSRIATWLARPLTSARDPMAGFFCLRRETLRGAGRLNPIGYKIGLELLVKARCRRVVEVPITFSDRRHGESKLTNKQRIEYLRHLWDLYRFRFPWLVPLILALSLLAASLPFIPRAPWR